MKLQITISPKKAEIAKKVINNEVSGTFDYASFMKQEQDNVWITDDYDYHGAYTTLCDLVYDGLVLDLESHGINVEEEIELLEIE